MDSRELDILKILLENGELQFHQIQSKIRSERNSWDFSDDSSLRVTLVKVLGKLQKPKVGEALIVRKDLGHKNVRYALKNRKAKQKVKLMVKTAEGEWEKVFACIKELEVGKGNSEAEALSDIFQITTLVTLLSYYNKICGSHAQENKDTVSFYVEQAKNTLSCLLDVFHNALKKVPSAEMKRLLENEEITDNEKDKESELIKSLLEGDSPLTDTFLELLKPRMEH
jgi:maltooligosyltrehalose synthase